MGDIRAQPAALRVLFRPHRDRGSRCTRLSGLSGSQSRRLRGSRCLRQGPRYYCGKYLHGRLMCLLGSRGVKSSTVRDGGHFKSRSQSMWCPRDVAHGESRRCFRLKAGIPRGCDRFPGDLSCVGSLSNALRVRQEVGFLPPCFLRIMLDASYIAPSASASAWARARALLRL